MKIKKFEWRFWDSRVFGFFFLYYLLKINTFMQLMLNEMKNNIPDGL